MAKVTMKSLKLTKEEIKALESFRNGWGSRLWRGELLRLWRGEKNELDDFWSNSKILMGLKKKIGPENLTRLSVEYTGPDMD